VGLTGPLAGSYEVVSAIEIVDTPETIKLSLISTLELNVEIPVTVTP